MSEKKFVKFIIALVAIGLLFVAYGKYVTTKAREEAIESAELIEVTDEGYLIDFGGEVHEYVFD